MVNFLLEGPFWGQKEAAKSYFSGFLKILSYINTRLQELAWATPLILNCPFVFRHQLKICSLIETAHCPNNRKAKPVCHNQSGCIVLGDLRFHDSRRNPSLMDV